MTLVFDTEHILRASAVEVLANPFCIVGFMGMRQLLLLCISLCPMKGTKYRNRLYCFYFYFPIFSKMIYWTVNIFSNVFQSLLEINSLFFNRLLFSYESLILLQ